MASSQIGSTSSKPTEKDIKTALSDYLSNTSNLPFFKGLTPQDKENTRFCRMGQDSYLLSHKYPFYNLPLALLRRLPVYLIQQFKIQVEIDSGFYWALTNDVSFQGPTLREWDLFPSLRTLFSAQFAKSGSLPSLATDLLNNSDTVLLCVCYPVLEGILKFMMQNYVNQNGVVSKPFGDGRQRYNRNSRPISDLSVYLRALEVNPPNFISKPDLSADLKDFRKVMEQDFLPFRSSTRRDGWDWIYSLRNASLHGAINWTQLRSGLVTNLICMLVWHNLEQTEVDTGLQVASKRASTRSPFSHFACYPPDIRVILAKDIMSRQLTAKTVCAHELVS